MTDRKKVAACDKILERAVRRMAGEADAPIELILDRLLTFAGAQAVSMHGATRTAKVFRDLAGNIERGVFARLEHPKAEHRH